jgi:hypothetical protein
MPYAFEGKTICLSYVGYISKYLGTYVSEFMYGPIQSIYARTPQKFDFSLEVPNMPGSRFLHEVRRWV